MHGAEQILYREEESRFLMPTNVTFIQGLCTNFVYYPLYGRNAELNKYLSVKYWQ